MHVASTLADWALRLACLVHAVCGIRMGASLRSEVAAPTTSVAVFMSGVPERVLVMPFLENVVRVNADRGVAVDLFLSMAAHPATGSALYASASGESDWLQQETADRYTVDPAMRDIRRGEGTAATASILKSLCFLAQASGVVHCEGHVEASTPLVLPDDSLHESSISYYSPFTTQAGMHLLRRWRSLESLWQRARNVEVARGYNYSQALVVRDDAYWGAPYFLDYNELVEDPSILFTIPCLTSHGFNDKVLHMGRQAADTMMNTYSAWMHGDEALLRDSRSAEEFIYRLATAADLHQRPLGMPMTPASFTDSGLFCFRKQIFKLRYGYHACYGEESDDSSFTRFYHEFNCNDMNREYFGIVPPANVSAIHRAVQRIAGPERRPIILTVTDLPMVDMTQNMISSLLASGEEASCLVVGIQGGLCRRLEEIGASALQRAECVDFPLREELASSDTSPWGTAGYAEAVVLKHAILTITLLSGFSEGVLFTDPDIVYLKPPLQELRLYARDMDMVFSTNNALASGAQTCDEVAEKYEGADAGIGSLTVGRKGAHIDINTGLIYLRHTTAAGQLLMRTLMILAKENAGHRAGHFQQYSMVEAIKAMPHLSLAPVPCDRFVNGNVFWGHHALLAPRNVISVHANWMHSSLKRICFERVHLWEPFVAGASWWRELRSVPVQLTDAGIIVACGDSPRMEDHRDNPNAVFMLLRNALDSIQVVMSRLWPGH